MHDVLTGLQVRKTAIIAQVLTVLRFILHTNFAARRTFARPRASECLRICLCSLSIFFHAAAAAEKKGAAFAAPEFVFCRALTGIAKFVLTVRIGDKSVFFPFTVMSESGTFRLYVNAPFGNVIGVGCPRGATNIKEERRKMLYM